MPMLRSMITIRDMADFVAWESEHPSLREMVEAIAGAMGIQWKRPATINTTEAEESWAQWVLGN